MKDRLVVYKKTLPFSLNRHRTRLNRLINVLRYGFDGGGVGGEKWARCGASLIPLFNAISELARNPAPDGVSKMAKALNIAVDQAHNNGWWLNKFAHEDLFSRIQNGRHHSILKAAPALLRLRDFSLSDEVVTSQIFRYAQWAPVSFQPAKIHKAVLTSLPNLPGLSFEISTRLFKLSKKITVPAKALQEMIVPLLGQFYILPGKNGLVVEMRKGEEKVKIWEEKSLL